MKTLAPHATTEPAALKTAAPALQQLIDCAARLGCTPYADSYGNLFFRRSGTANGAPIQVGFGDAHCALVAKCLSQLAAPHSRAIEFVYYAPSLSDALEWPSAHQAPVPAHAFIGLSLTSPPAQHLSARWYQIRCQVAEQSAPSVMAQSHNAIVLAFHSITRIQALADKLAGHSHLQLSFSRLHLGQDQQVQVHLAVRHPDPAVLQAFAEQLPACLPASSAALALLTYRDEIRETAFSASIERFCQPLGIRAHPLALSVLHDAAYLASAGPSALITLNQSTAHAAALTQYLVTLAT